MFSLSLLQYLCRPKSKWGSPDNNEVVCSIHHVSSIGGLGQGTCSRQIRPPDYGFTYLNYLQGTYNQVFDLAACIRAWTQYVTGLHSHIDRPQGVHQTITSVFTFFILFSSTFTFSPFYSWGHAVEQLVDATRYKQEGRGFDPRWCYWNFFP